MNFSLHCKIEYFKNNNCFPSILNLFFQLMRLFRNDFQRNVQHSIHMSDITKRNSNVHFIRFLTIFENLPQFLKACLLNSFCVFFCFVLFLFFYIGKMVLLKIVPLLLMGIIGADGQSGKSTKSRN